MDVSLRLNWEPQTENAGFFTALWNGYYQELGLNVKLNLPDPDIQVTSRVASGGDTFGLAEPVNLVLARSKSLPIVEVMQIQHDAYLRYVAKKSSGINTLEDLKGKTASLFMGGGEYEFIAMLHAVGLSAKDVNLIPQPIGTMAPFYDDQVDLASVTLFNELQQIYTKGYKEEDLRIFSGKEYGVGLVAKGLFTSEKMIKESPEVVQAFVSASIRGWQFAYYHPEKTAEMFVEAYPNLDYERMLLMMHGFNALNSYGKGREFGLGYIAEEYFQTAKDVMNVVGLLERDITINECYELSFWEHTPTEYKATD